MKRTNKQQSKRVIVTGGSRGIGYAIVEKLLKEGYQVCLIARNNKELREATSRLMEFGKVDYMVLDLSDKKSINRFVKKWDNPIYALINNAGVARQEMLEEKDEGSWEYIIGTNLNGPYYLTKGLVNKIASNGRIVNISSQLGKEGRAGWGAYCASKFGLIGLTKCWAKELGKRGITVNAVCPGWVATQMALSDIAFRARKVGISQKKFMEQTCQNIELGRFTEPEEVASLVHFLVSTESNGITGRAWLMNSVTE